MPLPATLFKKTLWHRCFPVNFAKVLRTAGWPRQWLAKKISDNIVNIIEMGRCGQGIIATDNHSADINAFSALIKITF